MTKRFTLLVLSLSVGAMALDVAALARWKTVLTSSDVPWLALMMSFALVGTCCALVSAHQLGQVAWERLFSSVKTCVKVVVLAAVTAVCSLLWALSMGSSWGFLLLLSNPIVLAIFGAHVALWLLLILVFWRLSTLNRGDLILRASSVVMSAVYTLVVILCMHRLSKGALLEWVVLASVVGLLGWWVVSVCWCAGGSWRASKAQLAALCGLALLVPAAGLVAHTFDDSRAKVALYERTILTSSLMRGVHALVPPPSLDVGACPDVPMTQAPQVPASSGPDDDPLTGVVVIMVDALRADRLDAMTPQGAPVAPALSDYAKQSDWFKTAYTVMPSTRPTIRRVLSSTFALSDQDTHLFETLQQQGVDVHALPNHAFLDMYMQGVTVLDSSLLDKVYQFERTSERVHDKSLALLEHVKPGVPFVQFVHYYDPHAYYVPNDQFKADGSAFSLYNAEVQLTDYWLGQYLDKLKAHPVGGRTLVIVFSDHGDEFWEHGALHHGYQLYDESSRITMLVHDPRRASGRVVDAPASIVDIGPTIFDALGLEIPPSDGVSLLNVEAMRADRALPLRAISSTGVVSEGHKLIRQDRWGYVELYDLKRDPQERRSIADDHPALVHDLSCQIDALLKR